MKLLSKFFSIVLMFFIVSGCANKNTNTKRNAHDYRNKRPPASNIEHLSNKNKEPVPKFEQDSYYAFNSYDENIKYYHDTPPKEVFLDHKSQNKPVAKKKIKIYKKVQKQELPKPSEVAKMQESNRQDSKPEQKKPGLVKVVPKTSQVPASESGAPSGARKLVPMQHNDLGMDPVDIGPGANGLPSKLTLEKEIAYIRQDHIYSPAPDTGNTTPRQISESKSMFKQPPKEKESHAADGMKMNNSNQNNDTIDTHDLENRPIPLPFE